MRHSRVGLLAEPEFRESLTRLRLSICRYSVKPDDRGQGAMELCWLHDDRVVVDDANQPIQAIAIMFSFN